MDIKMDKIAIVILNWNGSKMMKTYLPSVIACSGDGAVYVADNGSTDDSLTVLEKEFPTVKRILLEKNWGFAGGYNKALEQVDAQYFVLLNSDIEVTEQWLQPMERFMDAHPEVAVCQPKLRSVHRKDYFEYAGAAGGFIDRLGYPFCRGRLFDTVERDEGQYNEPMPVLWATGACMMIRAEDYWRCGGLDARFFAHNEEIDLCWRLRTLGRQVYCLPETIVYHVGGGTLPKNNPMKTFLNFRNNLTMLYKILPEKELKQVMRLRWWLDYLAAFQTLVFNGNWGDCKAIFKARKAFRKWLPDFKDDREQIQKQRSVQVVPERLPISIVWQYYAKRRKRFTDLKI